MKRILKNRSRAVVDTTYNGKRYYIGPKGSIVLDDGGFDEFAADYLLATFGFLSEMTPKTEHPVQEQVSEARGVRVRRI